MNWLLLLPILCFSLLLLFFLVAWRTRFKTLLHQTARPLLALLLLTLLLNLSHSRLAERLLTGWLTPARVAIGLWLLVLLFLLVLLVRLLVFLIFDFLVARRAATRTPRVVRDLVVFLLYVAGLLLIMKYFLRSDISWLGVSSAVLTVVVGLAVQDILGNLFAGIVLNVENVLRLGDWIRIDGSEGRVEQLGWRSILVRTVDQELVTVPNGAVAKADVLVRGPGGTPVALRVIVGASYRHPPDGVSDVILGAVREAGEVLAEPAPQVVVKDFADSAVTYEVKFWTADYARQTPVCGDVRRRIWYAFRRHGIDIPFPIRDLRVRRPTAAAEADSRDLMAALRDNDVLASLDEQQLTRLLAGTEVVLFGRDEVVIREGEPGDALFQVLDGRVRVLKEKRELAVLDHGDFFGEISLVTGDPVSATVVAVAPSRLLRVTSARFRESVNMNETMARKLSEVIARRQDEMRSHSERAAAGDSATLKKSSENLFRRIVKYFNLVG